jgi:hypothetical protein
MCKLSNNLIMHMGAFGTLPPYICNLDLLSSLLKSFSADYILETICNDPSIIETNLRLKIQESPDYADQ